MKKRIRIALIVATLASLMMSATGFALSTAEVWNHHIEAWVQRDVEAIVSDYSNDSVLVLNHQKFKGQEEIAKAFEQLFIIFDHGVNQLEAPLVFDRFVYITWKFTPNGLHEYFGTDTFLIENGKIILQTIASPLYDTFPVSK